MRSPNPAPLTAARVVLWVMAALFSASSLQILLIAGGFLGLGTALPYAVIAALCALCALRLPRFALGGAVGVHVLLALVFFTQMARIGLGEPMGLVGMVLPLTAAALLLLPSSREHLRGNRR